MGPVHEAAYEVESNTRGAASSSDPAELGPFLAGSAQQTQALYRPISLKTHRDAAR